MIPIQFLGQTLPICELGHHTVERAANSWLTEFSFHSKIKNKTVRLNYALSYFILGYT